MTRKEFVQRRAGWHQAQKTLEAAYGSLKGGFQWVNSTPSMRCKLRILRARRQLRREYERACRTYEDRVRQEGRNFTSRTQKSNESWSI